VRHTEERFSSGRETDLKKKHFEKNGKIDTKGERCGWHKAFEEP
jgi:hypothetical protein